MSGVIFNRYQYPAVYLGFECDNGTVPFYEGTLFSEAWGEGFHHVAGYEEISQEEFSAEFERLLSQFKERIKV